MKKICIISFLFTLATATFCQKPPYLEFKSIANQVDSIINKADSSHLTQKMIRGRNDFLGEYIGVAFCSTQFPEIRKITLSINKNGEQVNYYCHNQKWQIIITSNVLYYRLSDSEYCEVIIRTSKNQLQEFILKTQDDFIVTLTRLLEL